MSQNNTIPLLSSQSKTKVCSRQLPWYVVSKNVFINSSESCSESFKMPLNIQTQNSEYASVMVSPYFTCRYNWCHLIALYSKHTIYSSSIQRLQQKSACIGFQLCLRVSKKYTFQSRVLYSRRTKIVKNVQIINGTMGKTVVSQHHPVLC